MTLSSYVHNREDVRLWCACLDVDAGRRCIDIGAQDPICDTVSLAICKLGWHGVHVVPTQTHADALGKALPDDTVIESASDEIAHCRAEVSWDSREILAGYRRSRQTDSIIAGAYNALS